MEKTRGLNVFQLKLIAVLTMTVDHVGQFLSPVLPIPFRFRIIGRIAAPIFFFMTAHGAHHTCDRRAYMLRLYLFSVGMSLATLFINRAAVSHGLSEIPNNIFAALFLLVLCIELIERLSKAAREKNAGETLLCVLWLLLALVLTPILTESVSTLAGEGASAYWIKGVVRALLPNILTCEGGFLTIIGVVFYFLRENRRALAVFFTVYCAFRLLFALPGGDAFTYDVQWMMLLALPFMLLYNNEPGPKTRAAKYFFYIYYPLHIFALYAIYLIIAR